MEDLTPFQRRIELEVLVRIGSDSYTSGPLEFTRIEAFRFSLAIPDLEERELIRKVENNTYELTDAGIQNYEALSGYFTDYILGLR